MTLPTESDLLAPRGVIPNRCFPLLVHRKTVPLPRAHPATGKAMPE